MTVPRHLLLALDAIANRECTDDTIPPSVAALDAAAELATIAAHIIYPVGGIPAECRDPARLCGPFARLWRLAGRPSTIRAGFLTPHMSAADIVAELTMSAAGLAQYCGGNLNSRADRKLAECCSFELCLYIGFLAITATGPEPRFEQRVPSPMDMTAYLDAATALFAAAAFPSSEPTK